MSQYQHCQYKLFLNNDILFGSDNPEELVAHIKENFPGGKLPPGGFKMGFAIQFGSTGKRLSAMQAQLWIDNPPARARLEHA
jgi:hypothetical protein